MKARVRAEAITRSARPSDFRPRCRLTSRHDDWAQRQVLLEHPLEQEIGNSLVVKEPVGVVGCITPWNYPLQVVAKVALRWPPDAVVLKRRSSLR